MRALENCILKDLKVVDSLGVGWLVGLMGLMGLILKSGRCKGRFFVRPG